VKKSLGEYGDKITADEKSKIEAAMKEVEDAVRGSDKAAIEARTNELAQASHKLAEQMYQAEQAKSQTSGAEAGAGSTEKAAADDVVDAEFTEVKDK